MRQYSKMIGMIMLLGLATTGSAMAVTHTVTQVGLTFEPADLTINVGDTVEWVWTSLNHTVTNGTGPLDPDVGTLFDEPLTSLNPLVSFTFDEIGDVPYFCSPHFIFDMVGIIRVQAPVGVQLPPAAFALQQNTPNPFNPITKISFVVPGAEGQQVPVTLGIYDLQGKLVRTLVNGLRSAAEHSVVWDGRDEAGRDLPSGVYAYRLAAGGHAARRSMTLLK